MASVRKLKKRQAKRLFLSQLVFAVAADPLDASSGLVLTLWSGRQSVSRALSPEWAATLGRLLVPGDQVPTVRRIFSIRCSGPADSRSAGDLGSQSGSDAF